MTYLHLKRNSPINTCSNAKNAVECTTRGNMLVSPDSLLSRYCDNRTIYCISETDTAHKAKDYTHRPVN